LDDGPALASGLATNIRAAAGRECCHEGTKHTKHVTKKEILLGSVREILRVPVAFVVEFCAVERGRSGGRQSKSFLVLFFKKEHFFFCWSDAACCHHCAT
jgi:hypothetical protein